MATVVEALERPLAGHFVPRIQALQTVSWVVTNSGMWAFGEQFRPASQASKTPIDGEDNDPPRGYSPRPVRRNGAMVADLMRSAVSGLSRRLSPPTLR